MGAFLIQSAGEGAMVIAVSWRQVGTSYSGNQRGFAFAIDSATGRELWRVSLGGDTSAAPISFTVDGHQVILVSAGQVTVHVRIVSRRCACHSLRPLCTFQ